METFVIKEEELPFDETFDGYEIKVIISGIFDVEWSSYFKKNRVDIHSLDFRFIKRDKDRNILEFTEKEKEEWHVEPNSEKNRDIVEELVDLWFNDKLDN